MTDTLKQLIFDQLKCASTPKRELHKHFPAADHAHYQDTLRKMQREGLIELVYVLAPCKARPKGRGKTKRVQIGRPRHG